MRAKNTKKPKSVKSDDFVFGYDAKKAFVMAYEWAINHYADWEDRHAIATNTGVIAASAVQEYINSRPKW